VACSVCSPAQSSGAPSQRGLKRIGENGDHWAQQLTALVLGFLVASAKSSFDAKTDGVARAAAAIILLDRVMAQYGPETSGARELLRKAAAARIDQMRPGAGITPPTAGGADVADAIEVLERQLHDLRPATDAQRALQSRALEITGELAQTRWLTLIRAAGTTIPAAFLVVLASWLTIVFAGFGLLAPRNAAVVLWLILCAISVSAAIFVILDLDSPYGGVIRIPDIPMHFALGQLGR
jgi:hypothetical protein